MKINRKIVLTITVLIAMANLVCAQDDAPQESTTQISAKSSWSPLPKVKTSKREQQIIDKVTRTIKTQFKSVQISFGKLDKDNNNKLDSSEISQLLKLSKIKGLTRVIATSRLISRYDRTDDKFVDWKEYEFAVNKAIQKAAERAKQIAASKLKTQKNDIPSSVNE